MRSRLETTLTLESIDKYRNWCLGRGQAENTVKAYTSDLRSFLAATGGLVEMEEYEDLAMSWLNLTRSETAPKTTGRRLTSLRSFAKWAGHPGLLDEYVAPTPSKGQPHPLREGIEGVTRMIEVARTHEQKALVALCGLVGLRVTEARMTSVKHFDLHDMMLTVRGKGDKTRVVPVGKLAWSSISSAMVDGLSRPGERLISYQDRSARKCITTLGVKAGISRPVASHDLRATFATEVYNRTNDQRLVQELLGHANGSTTEIYIAVAKGKMKDAVEF